MKLTKRDLEQTIRHLNSKIKSQAADYYRLDQEMKEDKERGFIVYRNEKRAKENAQAVAAVAEQSIIEVTAGWNASCNLNDSYQRQFTSEQKMRFSAEKIANDCNDQKMAALEELTEAKTLNISMTLSRNCYRDKAVRLQADVSSMRKEYFQLSDSVQEIDERLRVATTSNKSLRDLITKISDEIDGIDDEKVLTT